jgi:hypothetical protein
MKNVFFKVSLIFLASIISCNKDNSIDENTGSNLIKVNSISECKNSIVGIIVVELEKEGVEYSYTTGDRVLHINHINADFNCNMDKIEATVKIENGIITIEEKEILEGNPAKCDCVFDIEYSIQKVEPHVYTLKVPGMKDATIDLVNNPKGSFYEPRDIYPWKTGG